MLTPQPSTINQPPWLVDHTGHLLEYDDDLASVLAVVSVVVEAVVSSALVAVGYALFILGRVSKNINDYCIRIGAPQKKQSKFKIVYVRDYTSI